MRKVLIVLSETPQSDIDLAALRGFKLSGRTFIDGWEYELS